MSEPIDLLSVRLVGDELHFTLAAAVFEDPAAWGNVLADVARQIADSLREQEGRDPAATIAAVRDAFVADLTEVTGDGE